MKKNLFVILLFCVAITGIYFVLSNYFITTGNSHYLFIMIFSIPVFTAIAYLLYKNRNNKD